MIRYIFLDIDGTMTDGKIYYSSSGDEMKAFNIKDGLMLAAFVRHGINLVVITGRKSSIVSKRMLELGITEVYQGVTNKKIFLKEYMENNELYTGVVGYIGDDLNDLGAMKLCGFKACPVDACKEIKDCVDYVSSYIAGDGAIRDIFEHIAKEQGIWEKILEDYE